jgi:vacuolar-type H+-ATPase subunit E/Vma4
MSLDRLLETLERDARAEAARVLVAARGEAKAVRARAEAGVARRRAEALRAHEEALRADAAARLAVVRRRGRAVALDARQQLLERVRAATRERIAAAEGEAGSLAVRLRAALACHGAAPVEIHCAPALAEAVRAVARGRPGATVTPDGTAADPLVARAAGGALEVDATLAALLERHWPELAIDVVRELKAAR